MNFSMSKIAIDFLLNIDYILIMGFNRGKEYV